ncbi:MAG: type IV secretory system conjugative DNA transfer family protein [Eggerthellaceae bacterium]|nr:type IV secretory system conjugative DNA transfer family protein [Eggerthellaceae bacterium]
MRASLPKLVATIAFSAASFAIADAYAACLLSIPGQPASNLAAALSALPAWLASGHALSAEAGPVATGVVAACGAWIAWAYSLIREGNFRSGEEHGSAKWGKRREGRKFMDARDPFNNIILTEHYGMAMSRARHSRKYDRNRNVLVIGGSGSGKTRGYIEPNIMQMNASYFVTDPKGTTVVNLGWMLERHGYDVKVFDTIDFSHSTHYNPFAYFRSETDILEFVECFIDNTTSDKEHSNDPFWEKAERLLYVALIGYLIYHCPEEDRSFSGLVTLLSLAKAKESDEDYMSPLDLLFERVRTGKKYANAGSEPAPYDYDGKAAYGGETSGWRWVEIGKPVDVNEDFSLLHYKMFKDAAGKTLKSILISCNTRLEPVAIPQVREVLSRDEMELDRMGDEGRKIAVFAIMSDTRKTYSFLLAIMMWQTMNLLCDKALAEHGGSLPMPVTFLFDEFANIGKIPDIESMAAVVRSRNMSISVVLQSIAQLKANYSEETAQTIVDCCDTTLFLGGKSNETNREISEMAGKETVSTLTFNESRGTMSSSTRNWNVVERDLIQSAEVGKMPRDEAIVLIAGTDPLRDRKYDIESHPRWKEVHPGHGGSICEPYDPGKGEGQ